MDIPYVGDDYNKLFKCLKEDTLKIFSKAIVEENSRKEFKELTKESVAIIRTGENTPYANVILVFGVIN